MPTQHSWVVHSWLSDCFYYLLWLGAESIAPDRGERALALFRFVRNVSRTLRQLLFEISEFFLC